MNPFVTAAIFNYPHEIAVLKHRLEMEGIAHFFENEGMASVAPMYSVALGGIRLKVHPDDLDTVRSILDDLDDPTRLTIV